MTTLTIGIITSLNIVNKFTTMQGTLWVYQVM